MENTVLSALTQQGIEQLYQEDQALYQLLEAEYQRQSYTLAMVASSSIADSSVLACQGMTAVNVTAEGYPGKRYHAGCMVIDQIEQMAIDRAKKAFHAQYANVQPHSATTANQIVMSTLLEPGDTILGMELQYGGHLTHGSKASFSGTYFHAIGYGLDERELIDYEQVRLLAHEYRPKLIICGATAYPRHIDFERFRQIADEVGAFLLADISHVAGLVIAGLHPNPINHAHITTTCTHKQLFGPRGGLILMGRDAMAPVQDGKKTLSDLMQRAVFPYFQGAPIMNTIAAKARALGRAMTPEFREVAHHIIANADSLAHYFIERGYRVISNGTDNHIVLLDVTTCENTGVTGIIAEKALEECGITVNKNRIAGDKRSTVVTSGIRLGTNSLAMRGMRANDMQQCGELIHQVLNSLHVLSDREYCLDDAIRNQVRDCVKQLCIKYPIPSYPQS